MQRLQISFDVCLSVEQTTRISVLLLSAKLREDNRINVITFMQAYFTLLNEVTHL